MATNMRILYNNLWKNYTITSYSSQDSKFPATNTQHIWKCKKWRTTDISSESIKLDLTEEKTINTLFILAHNLTLGSASATLKLYDSTNTLIYTHTITIKQDIIEFFSDKQARYIELNFSDASNSDGYIEIGVIGVGEYAEMERNYNYGSSIDYNDISIINMSDTGQIVAVERDIFKRKNFVFEGVQSNQASIFIDMFNTVGNHDPIFVVWKPDDRYNNFLYSRISNFRIIEVANEIYRVELAIMEIR